MGKSLCNILLVTILVLIVSSDYKMGMMVMGTRMCSTAIRGYTCNEGGYDLGCENACLKLFKQSKSICIPSNSNGAFTCVCNHPC
ncbi:hypothetical protein CsatB_028013 [Cannabis sativa]|uniref:Uncharacterized protein n=1 Tax=Cannabis sativa TaxID=3483 RepID=A0A7J6H127_CANSA|nr:hypothetical protein G4B88_019008 [Cannabis sativa]